MPSYAKSKNTKETNKANVNDTQSILMDINIDGSSCTVLKDEAYEKGSVDSEMSLMGTSKGVSSDKKVYNNRETKELSQIDSAYIECIDIDAELDFCLVKCNKRKKTFNFSMYIDNKWEQNSFPYSSKNVA